MIGNDPDRPQPENEDEGDHHLDERPVVPHRMGNRGSTPGGLLRHADAEHARVDVGEPEDQRGDQHGQPDPSGVGGSPVEIAITDVARMSP